MIKKKLKRLAITCGGTGGHFYPGLSIARYLVNDGCKVLLLLSGRNVESQYQEAAKYSIDAIKLPSIPQKKGPLYLLAMWKVYRKSRKELRNFQPEALLGMGSFASFPTAMAAVELGMPLFLHDGNARVGRANRILSRWAKHIGTAFPAVNGGKVACPINCTGMPLRPELTRRCRLNKKLAIEQLNKSYNCDFKTGAPTLLIFGGSQGAVVFNKTFPEVLNKLDVGEFQVIHLTGDKNYNDVKDVYSNAKFPVLLLPSTDEMHLMYQAADLVICRSGGSTIAELILFCKYAIMIPYPYAAEFHQDDNARYYASTGSGEILFNDNCVPEKVEELLLRVLPIISELVVKARNNHGLVHQMSMAAVENVLAIEEHLYSKS